LYQILESRYIVIVEIQMRKLISEKKNYLYSKWIFEKYVEKKSQSRYFIKSWNMVLQLIFSQTSGKETNVLHKNIIDYTSFPT